MPSLQSYFLSFMLRRNMKRRAPPALDADEARYVKAARAILNNPKLVPKTLPAEIKLTEMDENGVRGEWIKMHGKESPKTIIYFHGGGYVGGSPQTYRTMTTTLAKTAGAKIFVPDYRLAPEHRFPAAITDCLKAYKYVLAQTDFQNVVFAGDSAGGGLLMATMLAARDEQLPLPKAAVCYSPFADLTVTGESLNSNDNRCAMFYGNSIRRVARVYVDEILAQSPLASPVLADLDGLPPLQIFASTSEVLLDDSLHLAERAQACNVPVELHVWKNLPHVWPIFPFLPEARRALKLTVEFINRH